MTKQVLFGKGLIASMESEENVKVVVTAQKLSEELDSAEADQKEINKEHATEEKASDVENNANVDEISTKTDEVVEVSVGNEELEEEEQVETPLIKPEQETEADVVVNVNVENEPEVEPEVQEETEEEKVAEEVVEEEAKERPVEEEQTKEEQPAVVESEEEVDPEVSERQAEEAIHALESLKEVVSPNLNALRDQHNFIRASVGLGSKMFYSPEGLEETQEVIRASLLKRSAFSMESLDAKGPEYTDMEAYAISNEGMQDAFNAMDALGKLNRLKGTQINEHTRTPLTIAVESICEDIGIKTVSLENAVAVIDNDGKEIKPNLSKRIVETLKKWWEAFKAAMKKFGTWVKGIATKIPFGKLKQFFKDKLNRKKVEAIQYLLENKDKEVEIEEVASAVGYPSVEELLSVLGGSPLFQYNKETKKISVKAEASGRLQYMLFSTVVKYKNKQRRINDVIDTTLGTVGASQYYLNNVDKVSPEQIKEAKLVKDAFKGKVSLYEKPEAIKIETGFAKGNFGIVNDENYNDAINKTFFETSPEETEVNVHKQAIPKDILTEIYDAFNSRLDIFEKVLNKGQDVEIKQLLKVVEEEDEKFQNLVIKQVTVVNALLQREVRAALQFVKLAEYITLLGTRRYKNG